MSPQIFLWLVIPIAAILILVLPPSWVIVPLLTIGTLAPLTEVIVVFGLHFPVDRILIVAGCARLLIKGPARRRVFTKADKLMIAFVITSVVMHTLLWLTADALVNRLGFALDALGMFFIVRSCISEFEDVERIVKVLAVMTIAISISMIAEKMTGRNMFSVFGLPDISQVRLGRIRAQGPFAHSILAGTFAATLFPIFISMRWWVNKRRWLPYAAAASSIIMVISSGSGGPVGALAAGIAGLCLWPLRRNMRAVRWGVLFAGIALHLVMKAPVWGLVGRLNLVDGNTAYHREVLIDQFIRRFGEWCLLGVKSTEHWGPGFLAMNDLTNQFIFVGVKGGILPLVLFIALIVRSFNAVDRACLELVGSARLQRLTWAFGVSLFAHVVAFMGVEYFDQSVLVFYALLATISSLDGLVGRHSRRAAEIGPEDDIGETLVEPRLASAL